DVIKEVKGPPGKIARDESGNPTPAVRGFARSQKVEINDLFMKSTPHGEYVFAKIVETGRNAMEILTELLPAIIKKIYFPKNMYWEESQFRFARPVRWILALLGTQVIPFKIASLSSGRFTFGHRFLSAGPLEISSTETFRDILYENKVILSQDERKEMIEKQIKSLIREPGADILNNPSLMEEVNFLIEYPTSFAGNFSPDYLVLPKEVLITVMSKHQRYFTVLDTDGNILPCFIAVRNGDEKGLSLVRAGNERVLVARLADAKFFFEEDKKKSLQEILYKLKGIGFQKNLGTMLDKTNRIKELSRFILISMNKKELLPYGERAAELCKADLASHMVKEFPELQGIMGGIYALEEEEAVWKGIRSHYKPSSVNDELPDTLIGQVISLADKMDNVTGCFGAGFLPTGSADPYGVRRYTLGVIRLLLYGELEVNLLDLFYRAFELYLEGGFSLKDKKVAEIDFEDFVFQRFENHLLSAGYKYDVIKSIRKGAFINLKDTLLKIKALTIVRDLPEFDSLVIAFTRAFNILQKASFNLNFSTSLLIEEEEHNLYDNFKRTSNELEEFFNKPVIDYTEVMNRLSSLRTCIDRFFDHVMVMVPEDALRNNRLSLLDMVVRLYLRIADFSQIVVEGSEK
ncbi:MAG TPA: glycine--tRNA ligase subunit beta, partial [Candidatus Eremiobacteraeota bacterium]|nr:glycine--tRNA ligase subunit beta [Candidatus Eremiobacteraeota bacterium]